MIDHVATFDLIAAADRRRIEIGDDEQPHVQAAGMSSD